MKNIFLFSVAAILLLGASHSLFAAQGQVGVRAIVSDYTTQKMITPAEGGNSTLTKQNGSTVVLSFPPNFSTVEGDIRTQAVAYDKQVFSSAKPPPSSKSFLDTVYDFDLIDEEGDSITSVSLSVSVTIRYSDEEVEGLDESTIAPYRWGEDENAWLLISGSTVNAAANEVTFSTTHFSSFALVADAQGESESGSVGGGGSGNVSGGDTFDWGTLFRNQVLFTGQAYSGSKVTLLKDGQVAAIVPVDAKASFRISISGISGGTYSFSIYAADEQGIRSSMQNFFVTLSTGTSKSIEGIVIRPVEALEEEIQPGEAVASPQEEIRADVNKDGRVNLIDFSIVAFWYKRQGAPAHLDLNDDHIVDLADMSIMAYYWTG